MNDSAEYARTSPDRWHAACHEAGHAVATVACGGTVGHAWIRGPRFGRGSWSGGVRCENDFQLTGHAADVVEVVVLYAGLRAALEAGEALASGIATSLGELTQLDAIAERLADAVGICARDIAAWTNDAVRTVLTENERELARFAQKLARGGRVPWPRSMELLRDVRRFDAVAAFERALGPLARDAVIPSPRAR